MKKLLFMIPIVLLAVLTSHVLRLKIKGKVDEKAFREATNEMMNVKISKGKSAIAEET